MLYIHIVEGFEKGVLKKINSQVKALNKYLEIDCIEIKHNKYYLNNLEIGSGNTLSKTLHSRINKKIKNIKIIYNLRKKKLYSDYKCIYIRYLGSYPWTYSYIKFLKKIGLKIIIEIPTYPYDNEIKKENIFTKIDKYYRKKLSKYVDRIVTYSEDKEIWGIPCINISNGIDLEEVRLVNRKEKSKEEIIFTSVSNCSFWHGIDRFLKSLEKYGEQENKKEIIFNIIGEGTESYNLKEIVSKSEYLSKVVKFQGFKMGKDLDNIYDETDIAVGCLGNHRKGIYTIQALKNKEYMAKGLPMIFSEDDPGLRDKEFVFKASHNEKLIEIDELIRWYESLKITPEKIRKCAEEFTWDKQMRKVIENI